MKRKNLEFYQPEPTSILYRLWYITILHAAVVEDLNIMFIEISILSVPIAFHLRIFPLSIRAAMAMGRLSRMNGGVIGPLTGAHSMMSNKVNSNADQKNLNSNHSQLFASSAFAASANSRAEVSAMDTGTSFDGGLDMSDFASSRPQVS